MNPKFISIQVPLLALFGSSWICFFICFCCKLVEVFGLTIRSWERGGKLQSESCSVPFLQEHSRKTLSLELKHYSRKHPTSAASLDSGVGCRCTVTPEAGRLACRRDPPVALQSLYGQGWELLGAQSFHSAL